MDRNRISLQLNRVIGLMPAAAPAQSLATSALASTSASASMGSSGSMGASASTAVVLVPLVAPAATWQAELYRMARERAQLDLAWATLNRRFFSVWN